MATVVVLNSWDIECEIDGSADRVPKGKVPWLVEE